MPPLKVLPIPCPYCSGTVLANGTVSCKKCKTEWRSYTRAATGLSVGYTESAVYNFAVVALHAEVTFVRNLTRDKATIDQVRQASIHLERASRAMSLMISEVEKNIAEKFNASHD